MAQSNSISEEIDQLPLEHSSLRETPARSTTNVIEFKMPKALKRPRDVSYSVRSLYDDIKRGLIDVNPEYQRDVVWKPEKQMMLIDSVFTNHYMPPIILSVIYDGNGAEVKKICLDGKQRLTSLQLFMDGIIPLKHPDTSRNWWFQVDESSTPKTNKHIIPEHIRTSFVNRQIRCTEYEELDEEDEREIFRRVQLGVALSSAEKLRVLNTRRAKFINELKDLFVTERGLAAPSFRWERSRGADYRCLAQAVYVISKWGTDRSSALKNAGTLPQVERWLEDDTDPVPDEFSSVIKETFSILVELTAKEEYSAPFSMYAKVSPVEIIGISVLIYAHSVIAPTGEKLNLTELSAAFSKMRQDVRREHKDIRLNDRVGKTIIGFVKAYRKAAIEAPQASRSLSISEMTRPQAMAVDMSSPHKQYSNKRKRESYRVDEHVVKRLSVESSALSSTPVSNAYVLTFSPPGVPTANLASASPYTPLVRTSQELAPYSAQPHYVVGPSGYRYPGAYMHTSSSQFHTDPSQYRSPPPPVTPTPSSRSEASSSSSGYGDAMLVYPPNSPDVESGSPPTPSPAMEFDALSQLQGVNHKNGQQVATDRRPSTVSKAGPTWQSYQSMAESKQ
ncbi:hypothetical protein DFJ43DRAFT_1157769 [Lentinula guzmanii]|uniref:GmrSD restriction endonucleases N-terminal domain-containing protein n=1 Tax=Lentinula guzmanii TaxID=2804957 RepID=A0AA38J733_9AGAR|nr:hypothetical protein DFJ43DRAFT_1157769 [Lentinula guzmanii]